MVLIISFSGEIKAQDKPVQVSINSIRTELKQSAMKLGIKYLQSLDTLYGFNKEHFKDWEKGLLTFSPEFKIETGNNDAFSSMTGKMAGFIMLFDTVNIAGVITPKTGKMFHVFPFSTGFETSNAFQKVNGIVEVGYVPWYQIPIANAPRILSFTNINLFLQGGYKFDIDNKNPITGMGGNVDESKEMSDKPIFRAKGHFGIDTKDLLTNTNSTRGISLIGNSDVWYDFLNSEIYYSIEGKLRVFLTKDYFFDFTYEKGSGAPNFNQGEQFGVGLTVSF
jgi:hypothetical protein